MGQEIKVPLACDTDGSLVRPGQAQKSIAYRCPSCGGELYLRSGTRTPHFYHHILPEDCEFSYETEEHFLAKLRIQQAVEERLDIGFTRFCRKCGERFAESFSEDAVHATLEFRLPSGRRADVALVGDGGVVLGVVEVYATHAVDSEKAAEISEFPWVEVAAEDVLAKDNWHPRQDHWGPSLCPACQENPERPLHFDGEMRKWVFCPTEQRLVIAVDKCSWCKILIGVTHEGVVCRGGRADDNR